jgi:hypothetical protein
MKNKLILTLIVSMFLISLVSANQIATLGTFKQNECIELKQSCADCSYVNFSRVSYPDGTRAMNNTVATKDGSIFNLEFCNTDQLGTYIVEGIGDVEGTDTVFAYDFEVSHTGKELTSAKATSYAIIIIISVLIFVGLLWIGLALPSGNKTDEFTGYVIAIRNLKYLKYVLLGFSYINLLWISYFSWMITYAYLDFEFLSNIFRFMFTFLVILTLPLFILFAWITISNLVKDSQVADALMRGLRVK